MKQKEGESRKRAIFISHRHADKKIAGAIRDTLQEWSTGRISIFQSSDPKLSTRIGEPLSSELKTALDDANVVLLVYTFTDQDWSYCMWECGVATDPKREHTRHVVFQCTSDMPAPFQDRVRVNITEEEIKKFTKQFHTDPQFFPGFDEAFSPDIEEDTLDRMSKTLYERLSKVVPTKKLEERYRWDFLTLVLDSTYVRKIRDEKNSENASKLAADIIPTNCLVKKAFGEAFKHFGFDRFEESKTFGGLFRRWEQNAGDSPKKWISELYAEMTRAIRNESAVPAWERLKSVRPNVNWWLFPVINHVRVLPDDSMEFDLYLHRIPDNIVTALSEKKKAT